MILGMDGQRVIVFGAARGIGRAIALAFAAENCRVVALDRESITDPDLVRKCEVTQGDVTSYAEMQQLAKRWSDVEHVVFSVGSGSGKFGFPFWNLEPTDWPRVIEVNLMGAVNVAHAFAPQLTLRGRGSFQFVVSVAGQIGSQTDPPYSAAKAALINFVQCAAKDLATFGVRANALSPGMVKTDLNRSVWEAGQALLPDHERKSYELWGEEKIRKVSPLGRWQTAEEMASMSVYLASEHARNITGQTINIDGGQVMHS